MERWLLLRGLTRAAWHWQELPASLERRLGVEVVTLDLPGVGTERTRRAPWHLGRTVDDLRARWLALAPGGTWRVLGVSMGGMAALSWCASHPADFAAAVVVNTSARDLGLPWERFAFAGLPRVASALASTDPAHRERTVLALTVNDAARREAALTSFAEHARRAPVARRTFLAQMVAAGRFRAPARVEVPVLVLASTHDRLVSVSCSRRLAARLGAPLHEHPTAGHDLAFDDPAWLVARVAEWARGAAGITAAR